MPRCRSRGGRRTAACAWVCFHVANTSPPRLDSPAWPRVTAIGLELPGDSSGFALIAPLDGAWELVERQTAAIPGRGTVTLDVALFPRVDQGWLGARPQDPPGLPPGQAAVRGSGTRFCLSGPFPDTLPHPTVPGQTVATTIEQLLNGVVVGFVRVDSDAPSPELGIWDSPLRVVPLYGAGQ